MTGTTANNSMMTIMVLQHTITPVLHLSEGRKKYAVPINGTLSINKFILDLAGTIIPGNSLDWSNLENIGPI